MKIFSMNDCDWMAAETLEEAKAEYLATVWSGIVDEGTFDDPGEVPADKMQTMKFRREEDEPGPRVCSFQDELDRLIANGAKFPRFFASTEY